DGGAAERDLPEPLERALDPRLAFAYLGGVAAELLPQRDGDGVHPVRSARLDDVVELRRLRRERTGEAIERGNQIVDDAVERGDDARGGSLDPAEPARDVERDGLAGDREVVDRLAGLPAPELLGHATESSSRAFVSSSSQLVSLTRGRPRGAPSPRSCSSIACQPAYSTKSRPRPRRSSSSSPPSASSRPAAASSSRRPHA